MVDDGRWIFSIFLPLEGLFNWHDSYLSSSEMGNLVPQTLGNLVLQTLGNLVLAGPILYAGQPCRLECTYKALTVTKLRRWEYKAFISLCREWKSHQSIAADFPVRPKIEVAWLYMVEFWQRRIFLTWPFLALKRTGDSRAQTLNLEQA